MFSQAMRQLIFTTTPTTDDLNKLRAADSNPDGGPPDPIMLLESQLSGHPSSQKNYLFHDFNAWLTYTNGQVRVHTTAFAGDEALHEQLQSIANESDPWRAIAQFREMLPGYHAGYLAYDLKNAREALRSDNPACVELPDLWIGYPRQVHIFTEPVPDEFLSGNATLVNLRTTMSKSDYQHAITHAQQRIHEGDYYEINLSHLLRSEFNGNPAALYADMRRRGPVPYAALMRLPGPVHVCCASPERFLHKVNQRLTSDPIKGTRPRGSTPDLDQQNRLELLHSDKERAENLMIVDLVRNDLNRVCKPGSVAVDHLFEIQSFATVHQMVSRVSGEIRPDIASEQALAACFPMGSMTGAPKIRAMEDIERLETYRRGLYSGAIGFFSPEGDFNFNVVIRTAIIDNGNLFYPVGGAITADSNPEAEWEETLVKARALHFNSPTSE